MVKLMQNLRIEKQMTVSEILSFNFVIKFEFSNRKSTLP